MRTWVLPGEGPTEGDGAVEVVQRKTIYGAFRFIFIFCGHGR
jgi:hypothetical protein